MTHTPRIAFVTIGQSPRPDIIPQLIQNLDSPVITEEFGALDDVEDISVEPLTPFSDPLTLHTRLKNGEFTLVPTKLIEDRIEVLCTRLDTENYDFIVIASTGLLGDLQLNTPVLHAQKVVDSWMQSLSMVDCRLGLIYPIDAPNRELVTHGSVIRNSNTYTLPGPSGNIDDITHALGNCDLIVMHSMAYTSEFARRVSAQTGKPAVTARKILASTLKMQLDNLTDTRQQGNKDVSTRLAQAYPQLTQRELQVARNVVDGLSNKEIARILDISHRTVEIHRGRVMKKIGVSSVSALVRQALML